MSPIAPQRSQRSLSTPSTSIQNSYQRISGGTPIIGSTGGRGAQLSPATKERLSLAEQRKLDEEKLASEAARIQKNIAMRQLGTIQSSIADPQKALSEYEKYLSSQIGKGQGNETIKQNLANYSSYLKGMTGIV